MNKLKMRIGEIILHGFRASDRYTIADAIERELKTIFRHKGVPRSLHESSGNIRMSLDGFEFDENAKPGTIGREIANSIYGRLSE
ncbi:MAG: hypothetical protein OEY64_10615 [Nitrospinota bacterium]|nr:hypothetical protein [Nitrospinota bacterium]